MYAGKRVLVTGGAGFIGSHLTGLLCRAMAQVRVLDNFSTGKRENLQELCGASLEIMEGDIRNPETCRRACEGIDVVFHLAAFVSVPESVANPELNYAINRTGTHNIFSAAITGGVRRIVYASSAAVYGNSGEVEKVETARRNYTSPYATSKGLCEDMAAKFAEATPDLVIVGLRFFNVYGPRQDPRSPYSGVISKFADCILNGKPVTIYGDGTQTRDFIYVGDVARVNFLAGIDDFPKRRLKPGAHVLNVGTGVATSLNDLLTAFPGGLGVQRVVLPEREGDVKHSVANMNHTIETLRLRGEMYSLREGLEMYWKSLHDLSCNDTSIDNE